MTPAIGASAAGTSGVGAMLAQSAGAPAAAGSAPGMPGAAASPAANGPAVDLARQQLEQTMGQIRGIADQVKQMAATNPAVAQEAQQIQELLKAIVIKSAQQAPMQTASGMAVPGGGM